MKTAFRKCLLGLMLIILSPYSFAQTTPDAKTLVDQGVALNDQGKYQDAKDKYNAAIKLDSKYYLAYYEMAYTLGAEGRATESIPYLETANKLAPNDGAVYNMLGNVYDDNKQPDKAIEYYKKGIKAAPDYQRLYYNLAVALYGQKQYTDAESNIIAAIKMDPKHASSHRILAMTANKQGRLGVSLLGWCNFLLMEPQSKRSAEALWYVKAIVNHGITREGTTKVNITVRPDDIAGMMMPMAVTSATSGKQNLSATDSLALQLTSLFQIAHTITTDKNLPFIATYYSDFFQKLANSGNMPAFTRYITLSAASEGSMDWLKAHETELTALDDWIKATKREL